MNKVYSLLRTNRTNQKEKPVNYKTVKVDGFTAIVQVPIDELIKERKMEKKDILELLSLNRVAYSSKDMKEEQYKRRKDLDSQLNAIEEEIERLRKEKKK